MPARCRRSRSSTRSASSTTGRWCSPAPSPPAAASSPPKRWAPTSPTPARCSSPPTEANATHGLQGRHRRPTPADGIVYTDLFTGVHGNYLKSSIKRAGLDPDHLPSERSLEDELRLGRLPGQGVEDIWGSGQGIGAVTQSRARRRHGRSPGAGVSRGEEAGVRVSLLVVKAIHLAAFAACVVAGFMKNSLLRPLAVSPRDLARVKVFDTLSASSAGVLILTGITMALWLAKPTTYYVHNPVFGLKLALFCQRARRLDEARYPGRAPRRRRKIGSCLLAFAPSCASILSACSRWRPWGAGWRQAGCDGLLFARRFCLNLPHGQAPASVRHRPRRPRHALPVLARKYRPRTFDDLIGQEAMVRTLTQRLRHRPHRPRLHAHRRARGRQDHHRAPAGPRPQLRERHGRTSPPIDLAAEGRHCRAIIEGRHMDVLEMDAASRTKVDEMRELHRRRALRAGRGPLQGLHHRRSAHAVDGGVQRAC